VPRVVAFFFFFFLPTGCFVVLAYPFQRPSFCAGDIFPGSRFIYAVFDNLLARIRC
jgi:hypothetical protein